MGGLEPEQAVGWGAVLGPSGRPARIPGAFKSAASVLRCGVSMFV